LCATGFAGAKFSVKFNQPEALAKPVAHFFGKLLLSQNTFTFSAKLFSDSSVVVAS
jgi:hypothetical protein